MEDLDSELDTDYSIDDSEMNLEMPELENAIPPYEDSCYNHEYSDSEYESIECDKDMLNTNDEDNNKDASHGEVSFKGYTQSEINSKYHKAEIEYSHAKADYQHHMDLAKTGTMPNNDELAHAREAYRRMESAEKEMYKWRYTHPDKK